MRADKVVLRQLPEVACPALVVALHRLPLARQRYGRVYVTSAVGREPVGSALLRVLVVPPAAGLGGLCFRRSLEQEAEAGRDERVRRGDRVGVVDGLVLAREGDPARVSRSSSFSSAPIWPDHSWSQPGGSFTCPGGTGLAAQGYFAMMAAVGCGRGG